MKIKELREKSLEELRHSEQQFKEELFNLRMQSTTKQLEKPSRLRELRRGIAQIKTLLKEEERSKPPQSAEKKDAKTVQEKTK